MSYSAVLLAGGKSSRMGSDKAWLEIEGEWLWRRQLDTLRELSPERLMISGTALAADNCDAISDDVVNAGPLGGISAALGKCEATHLVVLALDLPNMSADFFKVLLAHSSEEQGIVPVCSQGFEPLAAVYPVACSTLAATHLRRKEYSMQHFVRQAISQELVRVYEVPPNEISLFFNLNTPADYEKYRHCQIHSTR